MKKILLASALGLCAGGPGALAAFSSPMSHRGHFLDHQTGDGGNGGTMTEAQFRETVLSTTKAAKDMAAKADKTAESLLQNYNNLSAETKKAFEDLTKVKNAMNDVDGTLKAIQRVQSQLAREQRMAYGDPIERIVGVEDFRLRLNAAFREACAIPGDPVSKSAAFIRKALGEDSSPGSTLINTALFNEIYDVLSMYGKWNTLGVRRMGTKLTTLPIKTARASASFILTEGDTVSDDSTKAGTSANLEAEVIATLLNVSLQLLQDSEVDITRDLLDEFVEAFNQRLDYAAFVADGTADATHGGMTGIVNGGTAATAANGNVSIETTDLEDWVRPLTVVGDVVLSRNPKWWMHPTNIARACLVRDGNNRPLFQTALEAPAYGGIGSILGFPVIPVSVMSSSNAAGAKIAAFGDPQGQVVGVRQDFAFESSDQHKWNTLQRSFRGYGRAGVKIRRATAFGVLTLAAN